MDRADSIARMNEVFEDEQNAEVFIYDDDNFIIRIGSQGLVLDAGYFMWNISSGSYKRISMFNIPDRKKFTEAFKRPFKGL